MAMIVASRITRSAAQRKLSTAMMPGVALAPDNHIQTTTAIVTTVSTMPNPPIVRARAGVSLPHAAPRSSSMAPTVSTISGSSAMPN